MNNKERTPDWFKNSNNLPSPIRYATTPPRAQESSPSPTPASSRQNTLQSSFAQPVNPSGPPRPPQSSFAQPGNPFGPPGPLQSSFAQPGNPFGSSRPPQSSFAQHGFTSAPPRAQQSSWDPIRYPEGPMGLSAPREERILPSIENPRTSQYQPPGSAYGAQPPRQATPTQRRRGAPRSSASPGPIPSISGNPRASPGPTEQDRREGRPLVINIEDNLKQFKRFNGWIKTKSAQAKLVMTNAAGTRFWGVDISDMHPQFRTQKDKAVSFSNAQGVKSKGKTIGKSRQAHVSKGGAACKNCRLADRNAFDCGGPYKYSKGPPTACKPCLDIYQGNWKAAKAFCEWEPGSLPG